MSPQNGRAGGAALGKRLLATTAVALTLGLAGPALADGSLVTALDMGPGGDEDSRPWSSGAGHTTHVKQFITPTIFNEDLSEIVPYALEAWESNDDHTVWTYTLRDGLLWSDGTPMTANDWAFTAEFMTAPDWAGDRPGDRNLSLSEVAGFDAKTAGDADSLEGIEVIDDRTIQFTLSASNPRHFASLFRFYILPEHAVDFEPADYMTTDWFRDPSRFVGSGPFVVADYAPDEYLTLGANENYFQGRPALDELVIRYFGGDQTAALLALEADDIDFTYVTETDAPSLEDAYDIFSNLSGVVVMTRFNYNLVDDAFSDIRVRQAILHAIDRDAITENILGGTYVSIPCPIPYADLWPEDVTTYGYDPDRAASLLQEAGVDPGAISMEWVGHAGYDNTAHNSALQAVQAYLSQIGINDFSYRFVDIPTFRASYSPDGDWQNQYHGFGVPRFGNDVGRLWSNGGALGTGVTGYDYDADGFADAIAAISAAPTIDDYNAALGDFCRLHAEMLPDLQMWVGNRFGAADPSIANFWWQPAPAGGPYQDNAHTWAVQ